jgi:hypothetical protein
MKRLSFSSYCYYAVKSIIKIKKTKKIQFHFVIINNHGLTGKQVKQVSF